MKVGEVPLWRDSFVDYDTLRPTLDILCAMAASGSSAARKLARSRCFEVGDTVTVVKLGTQRGQRAAVSASHDAGRRVTVLMVTGPHAGRTKAYVPEHLRRINATAEMVVVPEAAELLEATALFTLIQREAVKVEQRFADELCGVADSLALLGFAIQVSAQSLWEWQDDRGAWRPFDTQTEAGVEMAYYEWTNNGGPPRISYHTTGSLRQRVAKLDFASMSQTNVETNKRRRVRRGDGTRQQIRQSAWEEIEKKKRTAQRLRQYIQQEFATLEQLKRFCTVNRGILVRVLATPVGLAGRQLTTFAELGQEGPALVAKLEALAFWHHGEISSMRASLEKVFAEHLCNGFTEVLLCCHQPSTTQLRLLRFP